ncbi:MAG: chemotaxis protein CheR [Spirochaetales bacterium]|nr:chemotaxis protein CheR [Spirochaetales bacterium]
MDRYVLSEETFYKLSDLVNKFMGIKMPIAKRALLEARLQKLIRGNDLGSFENYLDFISRKNHRDPDIVNFCNAVATNKTDFFRENAHFDFMTKTALPEIRDSGCRMIRVWSAASSTGEEPYTLAMVLAEFCEKNSGMDFSVLGTDISTKVLTKAKAGVYSREDVDGIPPDLMRKYLHSRSGGDFEIKDVLKRRMRWGRFNLMTRNYNVPGPFEIIFCRNVLIYFNRDNQALIYGKLLGQLVPDGYLFLGHSESMAGMSSRKQAVAPAVFRIS